MLRNIYHTVKILDLYSIQIYFDEHIAQIAREYSLTQDEIVHAYDWCVLEALTRTFQIVNQCKVEGHYRHDIYRCIYDVYGSYFEAFMRYTVAAHGIGFTPNQPVKAMVAGSNLFVAQGVPANARF